MSIVRAIGRLIWVPLSFLLAMTASLLFLATLGLERLTHIVSGISPEGDGVPEVVEIVLDAGLLLTGLTIVPAILVVLIGEIARIRSFLYYVVGGGVALAAIPLLGEAGSVQALPPAAMWQVFASSGFVGGFVYWLLAGRGA